MYFVPFATLRVSLRAVATELVAPQGFEPRLIGSEPTVLPLNEGAATLQTLTRRERTVSPLTAL